MKMMNSFKRVFLLGMFVSLGIECFAQTEVKDTSDFIRVEKQPCFPGGYDAIVPWLARNTVYPDTAVELGLTGKVYISFIVDETGMVDSVKVIKSVNKLLDDEAVRVVKKLPFTCAAEINGKPVKVTLTVPLNFMLETETIKAKNKKKKH